MKQHIVLDTLTGDDLPRRAEINLEARLNTGWTFLTAIVELTPSLVSPQRWHLYFVREIKS